MKEEWQQNALVGYQENAKHLFGYPESTLQEYVRDLTQFQAWLSGDGHSTGGRVGTNTDVINADEASESLRETVSIANRSGSSRANPSGGSGSESFIEQSRAASAHLLGCSREQIEEYIVSLSNRGLRATTINRKICSLNSFYVWAVHHRLVDVSPLVGVRKLKVPRRIPKFLTFEDIERLLSFTGSLRRTSTIRGKQVRAMISILYYPGLRREELVNMRFEHIEKVSDTEIYLHVFGKGDKQRLLPFPAPAFEAYENYVRFRPECVCPQAFISLKTLQPMSKFDVNNVCDQLSRKVKLSKKLTPHLLRHTFATHLHLKGQPIEHINALLGHESLNTTKIYVHIDAGRLRRSVEELYRPAPTEG
ncbi:tyrosine-type recombinase/integrase [Acidobacteria bacterium AH-259-G07]|nr:tyrosine-type recombinase/integrase [Acidobacteria bacterium AH-259-G07]